MKIDKGSYSGLDWVDALAARNKNMDLETELREVSEEKAAEDALQKTASIAFGRDDRPKGPGEAMTRKSAEIQDRLVLALRKQAADTIKAKLAIRDIDPVALGLVKSKQEWDAMDDAAAVEQIAKAAALEYKKRLSLAWQEKAMRPQVRELGFNPKTSQDGRIMSSAAANEETRGQLARVPANANSILDPGRIERMSKAETEHDKSVREAKERDKARIAAKKEALKPEDESTLGSEEVMNSGRIMRGGAGNDTSAFSSKAARNQVSMLDNLGDREKLTPEELKERLGQIFADRIPDTRGQIREANEERREAIQGKKAEKDRSWEKPSKPTTTGDLAKRLMGLWMPPEAE